LSLAVIGAFLNALGILLGALFGFVIRGPVSAASQNFFKSALGVFTVLAGLRLIYENVPGSFGPGLKVLLIAAAATVLGSWLGKLMQLQKLSNRMGRYAGELINQAQKKPPGNGGEGWAAGTILFSAAPLGFLGAVTDGTSGFFYILALKGVMDGLAMVSFVKIFRWPVVLCAVPVFLFLYGLTMAVHQWGLPWLDAHNLTHALNVTAGLQACIVTVVIFGVRRVELANYLPALVVAPLLAWWLA
jgi:uncharacterized membrane protein YqgA involved in biofilm formation